MYLCLTFTLCQEPYIAEHSQTALCNAHSYQQQITFICQNLHKTFTNTCMLSNKKQFVMLTALTQFVF